MKKRSGFTLIELVMVIAILAIVTVVGLTQFGNLKKRSAYKVAMQNIRQLSSALHTYALINENSADCFNNFDSLIDLQISGEGSGTYWTGPAGTFVWDAVANNPGIYNGSYKVLAATYDAGGGGGSTPELEAAKRANLGISSALEGKLGIYFLTEKDVEAFNTAGFETYLLHNCSTMQAHGPANRHPVCVGTHNEEGYAFVEGGPGFRPDMSAFYPTALRTGSPVAVLAPLSGSGANVSPSSAYRQLGYDMGLSTNEIQTLASMGNSGVESKLFKSMGPPGSAQGAAAMLVVFGIGPSSNFVIGRGGIGTEPRCEYYDRKTYRRFLAVFALASGGAGSTTDSSVIPVGILDCDGGTFKDGMYTADWAL